MTLVVQDTDTYTYVHIYLWLKCGNNSPQSTY